MLKGHQSLARVVTAWVVLGVLPLMGCGGEEAPPAEGVQAVSNPLSPDAQLLVEQGNTAQRDGRYADALDLFSQALEIHPDHPVPQFGSLMAAMAVGDTAMVRDMREKLATTGPELLDMLGPGGAMGAPMPGGGHMPSGTLPEGHPDTVTRPGGMVSSGN